MRKKQRINTGWGVHALVWQEGDLFVARAVEVEVASQGKTSQAAKKNLEEALDLYFEDEKLPKSKVVQLKGVELHRISSRSSYA